MNCLSAFSQGVDHIIEISRVAGVGVPGPFQVSQTAPFSIMTTMAGGGLEGFPHTVWGKECYTARAAMGISRHDGMGEVGLCCQVADGVVDECHIILSS